jgi:hypothetical protein
MSKRIDLPLINHVRRHCLFRPIRSRIRHLGVGMHFLEILLVALWRSLDSRLSGVPVRGTHFAVLIRELEGVDEAEGFVYAAADWEVVDSDLISKSQPCAKTLSRAHPSRAITLAPRHLYISPHPHVPVV